MDDILKNKWVVLVAAFTIFNFIAFIGFNILVNKTTDSVIERLEQGYSPSPYGPGLDPDKVEINNTVVPDRVFSEPRQISDRPLLTEFTDNQIKDVEESNRWQNQWEKDRGFN